MYQTVLNGFKHGQHYQALSAGVLFFYMFTTTPWVTYLVSGCPATTHSFTVGLRLWGHTLPLFEIGALTFELFNYLLTHQAATLFASPLCVV